MVQIGTDGQQYVVNMMVPIQMPPQQMQYRESQVVQVGPDGARNLFQLGPDGQYHFLRVVADVSPTTTAAAAAPAHTPATASIPQATPLVPTAMVVKTPTDAQDVENLESIASPGVSGCVETSLATTPEEPTATDTLLTTAVSEHGTIAAGELMAEIPPAKSIPLEISAAERVPIDGAPHKFVLSSEGTKEAVACINVKSADIAISGASEPAANALPGTIPKASIGTLKNIVTQLAQSTDTEAAPSTTPPQPASNGTEAATSPLPKVATNTQPPEQAQITTGSVAVAQVWSPVHGQQMVQGGSGGSHQAVHMQTQQQASYGQQLVQIGPDGRPPVIQRASLPRQHHPQQPQMQMQQMVQVGADGRQYVVNMMVPVQGHQRMTQPHHMHPSQQLYPPSQVYPQQHLPPPQHMQVVIDQYGNQQMVPVNRNTQVSSLRSVPRPVPPQAQFTPPKSTSTPAAFLAAHGLPLPLHGERKMTEKQRRQQEIYQHQFANEQEAIRAEGERIRQEQFLIAKGEAAQ